MMQTEEERVGGSVWPEEGVGGGGVVGGGEGNTAA